MCMFINTNVFVYKYEHMCVFQVKLGLVKPELGFIT